MRRFRGLRWWGAILGLVGGPADVLFFHLLGIRFELNGHPAQTLLAVNLALTYAVLGYLLGAVVEARRRDREAAAVIRSQMQDLQRARSRLFENERLAALGELAASVAHEVRNPLGVIRSATQTLAEILPANDPEGRRSCEFIIAEIDRLAAVVGSLLTFARPLRPRLRELSVDELFDQVVRLSATDAASRRVLAETPTGGIAPRIRGDPDLLCQVLLGLVANAAEAAGAEGVIRLAARVTNGSVELLVDDTGPGVPPELRSRVFEPFFTTREGGTGLGLSVARKIAEAHGGTIAVDEPPGGGARFIVRLPLTPEAVRAA